MITAHEAVRMINEEVTYKPNWKISAEIDLFDLIFSGDDRFTLIVSFDTVDSSDPELKREISPELPATIFIEEAWDKDALMRAVFNAVWTIEEHEAREFFRVGKSAPLHPHRVDGNDLWENTAQVTNPVVTSSVR